MPKYSGGRQYNQPVPEPIQPSVETIHPKPFDGTVKEIKKWLDARDIEYKSNALKDELLEILQDA